MFGAFMFGPFMFGPFRFGAFIPEAGDEMPGIAAAPNAWGNGIFEVATSGWS
jgi:hypothetical protein